MKTISKEKRFYNIVKRAIENGYKVNEKALQAIAEEVSEEAGEAIELNDGGALVDFLGNIIDGKSDIDFSFADAFEDVIMSCEDFLIEGIGIEGVCEGELETSSHNQHLSYCDDFGFCCHQDGEIVDWRRECDQKRVKWQDGKLVEARWADNHDEALNWNDDCFLLVDTFIDSEAKVTAVLVK